MNKYILLYIVTFLFLVNPALANTVNDNNLNARTRNQTELTVDQSTDLEATQSKIRQRNRIENNSQDTQLKINQRAQGRLTQVKQNLVNRVYDNIQKQLTKRYQILMASEVKIQARIQRLISQGKNLTPASDKLAETEALKIQYQAALGELANQVTAIQQSSQPFNQVSGLRLASQKVSNILKQIRQTQVEAIKLIINLND